MLEAWFPFKNLQPFYLVEKPALETFFLFTKYFSYKNAEFLSIKFEFEKDKDNSFLHFLKLVAN